MFAIEKKYWEFFQMHAAYLTWSSHEIRALRCRGDNNEFSYVRDSCVIAACYVNTRFWKWSREFAEQAWTVER
jgi:hypothetical protein